MRCRRGGRDAPWRSSAASTSRRAARWPTAKVRISSSLLVHRLGRLDGEFIAKEQRALGRDQFTGAHAIENLPIAVALFADFDRPPDETPAIRSHPNRHRAVAFAHH